MEVLSCSSQSSGKLRVKANNSTGDHVVIIDHIILSIEGDGWSWHTWHYQDDFVFGSGRVDTGWGGIMVEKNYSSGPAEVHATADFWEVDQRVKSPTVNIS